MGRRQTPLGKGFNFKVKNPLRTMRFSHTEYVADIIVDATGAYRTTFSLNPGVDVTFPWLSGVAPSFEKYVFHALSFEYVPQAAATSSGAVAICPDYDAADDNSALVKRQLLQFEDTVSTTLWTPVTMTCTKRNLRGLRYIRSNTLPENLDIKTYDVGNVTVLANSSLDEGKIIGELFVHYDIQLLIPQRSVELAGIGTIETTYSSTAPFFKSAGTVAEFVKVGDMDARILDDTSITVDSPGKHLVQMFVDAGTSLSLWGSTSVQNGTLTLLNSIMDNTFDFKASRAYIWDAPVGDVLTWLGSNGGGTINNTFRITALPQDFSI